MKRFAIFFIVASLLPGVVRSQAQQVEKRVEVSKAYMPRIESAARLPLHPDLVDTVVLRPEVDYAVTPLSIRTRLDVRPIRPATLNYWQFDRPLPFYLKAGMGYPLHSDLDFHASTQNADIGYAAGYINHDGSYGRIPRTPGSTRMALRMDNRIGAAAGLYLGRHLLEGEVAYRNEIYDRYGMFPGIAVFDAGGRRTVGDLRARVRIGDDFVDLSRWNFDVVLSGGRWWNPLDAASGRDDQRSFGGKASVGRGFGRHRLILGAGFEGEWGGDRRIASGSSFGYYDRTFSAALRYGYRNEMVDLELGADYYHDKVAGRRGADYVTPRLSLRFALGGGGFVPYLEADGHLRRNDMRALFGVNPYYAPAAAGAMLANTVDYGMRLGVNGALAGNRLTYRLYVGYTFIENNCFWYFGPTAGGEAGFDLRQGRLNVMSLNGELEYRPVSNFIFSIGGHGSTYFDHQPLSICLPEFEGTVQARYRHRKFSAGVIFRMQSIRYMSEVEDLAAADPVVVRNRRIPYTLDLGVDADWYVAENVTVFAEGRNLCNRKMYEWNGFPQWGVGFTVGVKLVF
ncbi:MAG: hypothetical protein K2O63_04885 [Alistipes sp.]|nr:hypothetical protein [Alistipes sp.]